MSKKALILGATGAMAVYLIPELSSKGLRTVGCDINANEAMDKYLEGI